MRKPLLRLTPLVQQDRGHTRMKQMNRSLAGGVVGLALLCAAYGLVCVGTTGASTMQADVAAATPADSTAGTPADTVFDPDIATAIPNRISQKARTQIQRLLAQQQYQRYRHTYA